jgi:hypothetical protein
MDSNIELITAIAHQVEAYLKQAVQQRQAAGEPVTLATLETELRECLRQTGAQALSEFLSSALGTPAATVPCACGETLHYQRRRSAVVVSVFGRVGYTRAYYAGCACGQGQAPVDEQYGIEPGQVSAGLAQLLSLAGVELPFEHSARWLKAFLLFDVSENTVRQETQQMGQLQIEREAALKHQSQDEAYLQTRLRATRSVPQRLYGLIDAGKVRIEPRDSAEKQGQPEAWRDMKLGCWCEAEAVPHAQRSVRQQAKYDHQQAVYRAKNIRYYCDITEAATFGELMWARGVEAQADLAPELVFVCDGATWIWKLVEHYYPHAVQIVDWYHAAARLERVAQAAFAANEVRQTWREEITEALWQGRVGEVIQACQALPRCEEAQDAATYFSNNEARMQYARFRAAGYLIGSGTVESGCKQIITQRLKCSGAQWTLAGAVQTAKARAAWLSGEWHTLCARREALPLAA